MIRKIHLLLGMFLTPWVVMYALSTMVMQHRELVYGQKQRINPEFKVVREEPYQASFKTGDDREAVALQILKDLDLEGAHSVRGNLEQGKLEINRNRAIGSYRITWEAGSDTVKVEQQEFGLAFFLEILHRRSKFNQPYWMNDAWAVIVDLFIVAVLGWAFTGLWMWWGMKSTRKLGGVVMAGGILLFTYLVMTI
jgi:hypothetical protein